MMGDFEDETEDLVDTDSFINQRGAGEEPFFVPDDNDSDSSEDNDAGIEWSHADLSAIMDELELIEGCSDINLKIEEDYLQWSSQEEESLHEILYDETEDEEKAGGDGEKRKTEGFSDEDCKASEEWYEYPYCIDFLRDFYCLRDSGLDVRQDLLNMLASSDMVPDSSYGNDESAFNQELHDEVEDAINDILIPGLSREGLKKLHRIVIREPTVNLKRHLERADPYLLAYIIWGLNYYLSLHVKSGMRKTQQINNESVNKDIYSIKEEDESFHNRLIALGLKLLSWLIDIIKGMNLGTSYGEVLRQISRLGGTPQEHGHVEYIHQ